MFKSIHWNAKQTSNVKVKNLGYTSFKKLPKTDFKKVNKINRDVARIYGRKFVNEDDLIVHPKIGIERRIIIVSPFRNANDYVYTHCKSIEQQDYNNYIHVLVDDASDDTPIIMDNKNRCVK